MAAYLHHNHKEKARVIEKPENKGVPEFMGTNPTYLLCLYQISKHESLLPIW